MRYRPLGQTGMHVSTLCLGTMMFGPIGNPDAADCARIVHAALDGGINLVDTADMYSDGESETIVGEALNGRRDEVILATNPTTGDNWSAGLGTSTGTPIRCRLTVSTMPTKRRRTACHVT